MSSPPLQPGAAGAQKPVGVALIGIGRWARTVGEALRRSPRLRLVTCFTRDPERRKGFGEEFGCGTEGSLEGALARPEVEAVIITAPNHVHAALTLAAAQARKHVFVDKPLATTIADGRAMIEACRKTGVILAVGHSSRRLRGHRLTKELLDRSALGIPVLVEANFSNDRGLHYPDDPQHWYKNPEAVPGGPLTQIAIHHIDTLQYLFGPIARVSAALRRRVVPPENPDVVALMLEFESGLVGYVGSSFVSPMGPQTWTYYVHILGTEANLFHDRWQGIRIRRKNRDDSEQIPYAELTIPQYVQIELEEFAEAVRGHGRPEVDGEAGLRCVAVVCAALLAAQQGRGIELSEVLS